MIAANPRRIKLILGARIEIRRRYYSSSFRPSWPASNVSEKTPLTNGIDGRRSENRVAIDDCKLCTGPMTVNNSVQLDSALDALLFCIFGINGLDAGEQVPSWRLVPWGCFFEFH